MNEENAAVILRTYDLFFRDDDYNDELDRIGIGFDRTISGELSDEENWNERKDEIMNAMNNKRKARTKCNCADCNPDFNEGRESVANVFECNICKKCFTKCKYFRRHIGLHSKTKTLECDICHLTFMFSYQLQAHRLTHTLGQKPFQCGICGKSFTSKYYLKQHEWVHNPHTPFKCRFCGKGYSSEGYFKRHELSHSQ